MPFIPTSQEWLTQSALLLEARPTTARVTTKYNIKPAKLRKARKDAAATTAPAADTTTSKPPRATLILKTFDPDSGVCLKYKTTKAAEVSRLVQLLGSLGRKMAALPDAPAPAVALEDEASAAGGTATPPAAGPGVGPAGAAGAAGAVGAAGAAGAGQAAAAQQGQAGGGGGGGGKGKKKKGKR